MSPQQPKNIVVIGGGIIGTTTAYFLATSSSRVPGSTITLVEGTKIAAGASGYSGGFLAKDWHGAATSSLAAMSYDLHKKLATEFNGESNWGYRTVETLSISTDATIPPSKSPSPLPWLPQGLIHSSRSLGSHSTTAQVHPRLFTQFFADQFTSKPDCSILFGSATSLKLVNGRAESVTIKLLTDKKENNGEEKVIPVDTVVIAAGPWIGGLAKILLPGSPGRSLGVTGHRAHSIVIKTKEELSAHCLFTDMTLEDGSVGEPEVYARPDGTTYICGAGDDAPLPPNPSQVKPSPTAIQKLHTQSQALSWHFSPSHGAEVIAEQACFLPIADRGRPLIGKVKGVEGVYVGGGHSCWGITLGPGTGLILSEMIWEGEAKSADVRKLVPMNMRFTRRKEKVFSSARIFRALGGMFRLSEN